MRFFISYSRSVKTELRPIVELLRAAGHEVWWDADIPVIADWWATILDHIEQCEVFIFVVSERSVQSDYCLAELGYATARNRPILPFLIDDHTRYTIPPEVMPGRNEWFEYDGNPARTLERIREASNQIDLKRYPDRRFAPRPPEPNTESDSLIKQYQQARVLAKGGRFGEAIKFFQNVKSLDFDDWGNDCEEWITRLQWYEQIAKLADHEATSTRAQNEWRSYLRTYKADFDPLDVPGKLAKNGMPPPTRRLTAPIALELIALLVVIIGAAVILLPKYGGAVSPTTLPTTLAPTPIPTTQIAFISSSTATPASSSTTPSRTAAPTSTPIPVTTHTYTPNFTPTLSLTDTFISGSTPIPTVTDDKQWTPLIQTISDAQMALVPPGCFKMGSDPKVDKGARPEEQPQFQVCFAQPFWIDVNDVTNADYQKFIDAGGYKQQGTWWIDAGWQWLQANNNAPYNYSGFTDGNQPRVGITWFEVYAYCQWRGARLPTEAEWEYAARGPSDPIYPWGFRSADIFDPSKAVSSVGSIASPHSAPVGSKPDGASWVGALDMSGNVWQWISSIYNDKAYGPNYKGADYESITDTNSSRVRRGGSWNDNDPNLLRAAGRLRNLPSNKDEFVGFRCAHAY